MSALDEDELYDLVLVDHVDRHVSSVQLRPHQRWAEHDADALSGHQVLPGEGQNSEKQQDKITDGNHEYRVYKTHRNCTPTTTKHNVY